MRRFLILLLVISIGGCVFVGRQGSYTRTDSLEQTGTNNRAHRITLDPK
jgi:hypothetical protein